MYLKVWIQIAKIKFKYTFQVHFQLLVNDKTVKNCYSKVHFDKKFGILERKYIYCIKIPAKKIRLVVPKSLILFLILKILIIISFFMLKVH